MLLPVAPSLGDKKEARPITTLARSAFFETKGFTRPYYTHAFLESYPLRIFRSFVLCLKDVRIIFEAYSSIVSTLDLKIWCQTFFFDKTKVFGIVDRFCCTRKCLYTVEYQQPFRKYKKVAGFLIQNFVHDDNIEDSIWMKLLFTAKIVSTNFYEFILEEAFSILAMGSLIDNSIFLCNFRPILTCRWMKLLRKKIILPVLNVIFHFLSRKFFLFFIKKIYPKKLFCRFWVQSFHFLSENCREKNYFASYRYDFLILSPKIVQEIIFFHAIFTFSLETLLRKRRISPIFKATCYFLPQKSPKHNYFAIF